MMNDESILGLDLDGVCVCVKHKGMKRAADGSCSLQGIRGFPGEAGAIGAQV